MQSLVDLHALLDGVSTDVYAGLSAAEQVEAAGLLARLKARIAGHELSCARAIQASGAAKAAGATSTGALLSNTFGGDRRGSDRMVRTAESIGRAPQTQNALAGGRVSEKQAALIAKTLPTVPEEHRDAAEAKLLDEAERIDLKALERRADRVAETYATPVEADRIENDLIAAREKRAWKKTSFWMVDNHDGTHQGGFVIPEAAADLRAEAGLGVHAPDRRHSR